MELRKLDAEEAELARLERLQALERANKHAHDS